jgi:hypothetical protein
LVEQSIRNRQVIGSSPIVGSILLLPLRGKPLESISSQESVLLIRAAQRVLGFALCSQKRSKH